MGNADKECAMKDTAVKAMFETIAPSYDFQNSFLSLRRDIYWRRVMAKELNPAAKSIVLDVAVGTAETALAIIDRYPDITVVGVDFSPGMLAVAKKKTTTRCPDGRIHLATGDARGLPVRSELFDAVTISFGIRNMEEREMVLKEFYRVLKPGGRLLIMEFSYPDNPLLNRLYRLYFDHILPPVGNWLSRTDYAYSYLADSVNIFPDDPGFLAEIREVGFTDLKVRKLTFGIAKIFQGVKEDK